jgi:hypothetical protein
MGITFRIGRDGLAHACPTGWVTALCGAQCTITTTTGVPHERCMQLAVEQAT